MKNSRMLSSRLCYLKLDESYIKNMDSILIDKFNNLYQNHNGYKFMIVFNASDYYNYGILLTGRYDFKIGNKLHIINLT